MSSEPTYRFPPSEGRPRLLGLSAPKLVILGAGAIGALACLVVLHSLLAGLGCVVAAVAWAWLPLSGRPVHEWVGPTAAHLSAPRTAIAPPRLHTFGDLRGSPTSLQRDAPSLPSLEGLQYGALETVDGELGIARIGHRVSFTLSLSGPAFSLTDGPAKARAVSSWADVLAACSQGRLRRLQLTERAVPENGERQLAWLDGLGADANGEAVSLYSTHVSRLVPSALSHSLHLSAVLEGGIRREGEMAHDYEWLSQTLQSCGFSTRPLCQGDLSNLVSSVLDPMTPQATELGGRGSWQRSWSQIRFERSCHTCFEAISLPQLAVGPDWLFPLLGEVESDTTRTLSLHLELASAQAGLRRAERAALHVEEEESIRARWGFRSGARHASLAEAALTREAELAAGFPDARFVLLADVAAEDPEELEARARSLVTSAARAGVGLRRLYGRQAEGLAAIAPLGALQLGGGWS